MPMWRRRSNKARNVEVKNRFGVCASVDYIFYDEFEFERRFRILLYLLERNDQIRRAKSTFMHMQDVTGIIGSPPHIYIITALIIIEYGLSCDQTNEFCKLETLSRGVSFLEFCYEISKPFSA